MVRSAAAPSPVRFSDFDSGPALRLLADVDIFFLAELLFADSDVGFAGSGRRGFDVGRHRLFLLVIFDSGRDDGARAVGAIDDDDVGLHLIGATDAAAAAEVRGRGADRPDRKLR